MKPADVIRKERLVEGGSPVYYAIGPQREAQEEAMQDYYRWQKADGVAPTMEVVGWSFDRGVTFAFYQTREEADYYAAGEEKVFPVYRLCVPEAAR